MSIQNISVELIILVFQSLNNIDDCLSFSHTCKQFHGVFQRFQIVIFKSVIINAKHHEHDIELGLLQDIYERHNLREIFLEPETTYDEVEKPVVPQINVNQVIEVVVRWHAMKILYDLYRSSSIHSHYVRANTVIHPAMDDRLYDCATEEAMPEPKDFNCTLDYGHRYAEYSRFYHALTAHWVLIEKIWLAKMTHYKMSSTRNDRYNQLWQLWADNPDRSLREKLDLIEVVEFIWGYLGRNIFKGRFAQLSDWVPQADLAQFTEHETSDSAWASFIARVTQELRPPHIIELLLLLNWNSKMAWRIDRPTYLRQLGFLVEPQSVEKWNDTDWPDTQFSLNILDEDVINSLVDMVGSEDSYDLCEKQWYNYKDTQWQGNMQGRILGYEMTSQQLFELIMSSGDV
ncbi:uncharacterized protein BO88DRAFT_440426 [Aspergillus vadensis CBS 113365]|uniref:F-box domain-containing protein n=1 Tax=Aspergillus vadensis (strain CBS 113365 / IMI 142717 / IBT 24658) TaxID=1448311 RepID=A0A319BRN6_ASPVC|nr:hypothetical protein BO88DRAFT_440426 [Aspergillus vadensis CBS 113365]PYH75174.1 hypothetical protein BO88DRAFT_440426 [Aspergillus vadensis CBS 113365]